MSETGTYCIELKTITERDYYLDVSDMVHTSSARQWRLTHMEVTPFLIDRPEYVSEATEDFASYEEAYEALLRMAGGFKSTYSYDPATGQSSWHMVHGSEKRTEVNGWQATYARIHVY